MSSPHSPRSAPYITPAGYQALEQELAALWRRRTAVTQALAAAAAEGDRSENAEYIYRKKELREIDRRVRYLQKRLPALVVVRDVPADRQRIFFGAWIRLKDAVGRCTTYRLVGPDEIDLRQGCISVDSPLARVLLKKTAGDEATLTTPQGTVRYEVIAVSYQGPPA